MLDITRAFGLNFLCPARDTAVGWSLRSSGEFARPEQDFLASILQSVDPVGAMVDVGANLGSISLPLAKRFPAWRFLGIEANRALSGLYAANALTNFLENVEWLHAAAGRAERLMDFPAVGWSTTGNFGDLSAATQGAKEKVRVCALDCIAPANVKLIKIDVQGAEMEVLAGAEGLIGDAKPFLFVEAAKDGAQASAATASIIDHLRSRNYRTFVFFSPFLTGLRQKFANTSLTLKGDYAIVGAPEGAAVGWDLPEILSGSAPWPGEFARFPYLLNYGFVPAA